MNYDSMLAGPEMDTLVAEKVMGLTAPWGMNHYELTGGGPYWIPNKYSTSISAAWEVVEKVWSVLPKPRYGTYRIQLNREDRRGMWICEFAIDPQGDWKTHVVGKADTAPLAICRAALKASEAKGA